MHAEWIYKRKNENMVKRSVTHTLRTICYIQHSSWYNKWNMSDRVQPPMYQIQYISQMRNTLKAILSIFQYEELKPHIKLKDKKGWTVITFRFKDLGSFLPLRFKDLGLFLPFWFKDLGALSPFCFSLHLHSLLNPCWRSNVPCIVNFK